MDFVKSINQNAVTVLVVAVLAIFGSNSSWALTHGSAVVDGDSSEWDLTSDFYAHMHRAGNPSKKVESELYLRYDCDTGTLYALVLAADGVPILTAPGLAFVKVDENSTDVDDTSGNDAVAPDFSWIGINGQNGEYATGWEASVPVAEGAHLINVHTQVFDDGSDQTSATTAGLSNNRFIELVIQCDNDNDSDPETEGDTFSVSGSIWVDLDKDGVFDGDESGLPNVPVTLLDWQGNAIATAVTDENGVYEFTDVVNGQYVVQVPEQFSAPEYDYQIQGPFSCNADVDGGNSAGHLFAFIPVFDISGTAFIDVNLNGIWDSDEPIVPNATVILYDSNGDPVGQFTTDENGYYLFENNPSGDYTVEIPAVTAFYADDANETLTEFFSPVSGIAINVSVTDADSIANDFGYTLDTADILDDLDPNDPDGDGFTFSGSGLTIGFWKHQLSVAIKGRGKAHIDAQTVQGYLDWIEEYYLENPFQFDDFDEFQSAFDVLKSTSSEPVDLLKKQLLGTEFNEIHGIGLDAPFDTLQEFLIQWGEYHAAHPSEFNGFQLIAAKDVFDRINNTSHF